MTAHAVDTNSGGARRTASALSERNDGGRTGHRASLRVRPGRSAAHSAGARGRRLEASHISTAGRPAAEPAPVTDPKTDIARCYEAHSPIVQRYVSRICGNEHSHDVTQDVFTAFWNSPAEFDPER